MPSSKGSTTARGTLKFLKDQVGSVLTISPPTRIRTPATSTGFRMMLASIGISICVKNSPAKSGNSAQPAPAGAGTPVKKL